MGAAGGNGATQGVLGLVGARAGIGGGDPHGKRQGASELTGFGRPRLWLGLARESPAWGMAVLAPSEGTRTIPRFGVAPRAIVDQPPPAIAQAGPSPSAASPGFGAQVQAALPHLDGSRIGLFCCGPGARCCQHGSAPAGCSHWPPQRVGQPDEPPTSQGCRATALGVSPPPRTGSLMALALPNRICPGGPSVTARVWRAGSWVAGVKRGQRPRCDAVRRLERIWPTEGGPTPSWGRNSAFCIVIDSAPHVGGRWRRFPRPAPGSPPAPP